MRVNIHGQNLKPALPFPAARVSSYSGFSFTFFMYRVLGFIFTEDEVEVVVG